MELQYPKYRWFTFAVCFALAVTNGMIMIGPSPIIQSIQESIGLSLGQTSAVVILTYTLGGAVGGFVGGYTIDRFGLAFTYVMTAILMIVGLIMAFAAGNVIPVLLLGRLIGGIGGGIPNATGPKLVALWFPGKERAVTIGFIGGALSLGITIGLMVSPQILVRSGNWHQAITYVGLLVIPSIILAFIMQRGPKPPVSDHMGAAESLAYSTGLFKQALKAPAFYAGILTIWFFSWILNTYNDLTPGNIAVDVPAGLGYGPVVAGQLMGIYSLFMLIGAFASGFILHNLFKENARLFTIISFILIAIFCGSVLIPAVNQNIPVMMLFLGIAGFFAGCPVPLTQAFISFSYPKEIQGRVGGISMGLGFTGGAVGLAVSSAMLHTTGNYTLSIISCVIAAVAGALIALLLKKPAVFSEKQEQVREE
ncbi:MAG: MFS transporter [Clostridiales Family XIII bacterium]|jgi:MFS family permease|nr:MFS transporter [Clostridiales Family XIII bacterium]